MGLSSNGFSHTFTGKAVSLNVWTHVAWTFNNYSWSAFINGVQLDTASDSSGAAYSPILHFSVGGSAGDWSSTQYKYFGNVFQPMFTRSVKYSANFTPATDLSVGASSQPVAFFMNPGIAASLTDLATGNAVLSENGASATGFRFLG